MNKNKRIIALLAALAVACTLTVGVSASEDADASEEYAETVTEGVLEDDGKVAAEGTGKEENEAVTEATPDEKDGGTEDAPEAKDENVFAEIYGAAKDNADKIFSLLAFLGTLIVSFAYKKGLIPLLSEAVGKFKNHLEKLKNDTDEHDAKVDSRIGEITQCVETVEKSLGKCTETLSRLDGELAGYGDIVKDHETMRTLFSYQIDMLYAIFMSSALPQYQKDEIGEKIATMREELAAYENKVE